eukprot:c9818_g1_i1.p1 GENE.c9818_g1_i1~~c9818_g1_i1.p1  ORF type:complete len:700 (+),score=180.76 c9818_g1_i1:477-2576(+)
MTKRADGFKSRHTAGKSRQRRIDLRKRKRTIIDESSESEGDRNPRKQKRQVRLKLRPEQANERPKREIDRRVKVALKDRNKEAKKTRRREEEHKVQPFRKNFWDDSETKKEKVTQDEQAEHEDLDENQFDGGEDIADVNDNDDEEMAQEAAAEGDENNQNLEECSDHIEEADNGDDACEGEAAVDQVEPFAAPKLVTREEMGIIIRTSVHCPAPFQCLADPKVPSTFIAAMQKMGFAEPSPVQRQCWPACLTGSDCLVLAEAGSGKTLGYTLPAIPHILAQRKIVLGDGPIAVILVPTRELAQQVAAVAKPLRKLFRIRCLACYGGVDSSLQADTLRSGVEILVCTPGRLLDLLKIKATNMGRVTYCVLDEADKMLDMGFEDQLNTITKQLRKDRQTLLFSATFPSAVDKAAQQWLLQNRIDIRLSTHKLFVSPTITQVVHVCSEHKKPRKMLRFIEKLRAKDKVELKRSRSAILVFCNRIKKVKTIASIISKHGERCAYICGEMKQDQRDKVLKEFKNGKVPILVATDVAARGIHITRLPVVINYDFPPSLVQYVHRIGRTGRQGALGHAFSFFTRNLAPMAKGLVNLLSRTNQWIDPNLKQMADQSERSSVKKGEQAEEEEDGAYHGSGYHASLDEDGDDGDGDDGDNNENDDDVDDDDGEEEDAAAGGDGEGDGDDSGAYGDGGLYHANLDSDDDE